MVQNEPTPLPRPSKGKSLAEVNPALARQWHPEKNGGLTPVSVSSGSSKRVWWLCPKDSCGYEWTAVINDRSHGLGCKKCAIKARSIPAKGKSLADVNPDVAKEWHPQKNGERTPYHVWPGAASKAWWLCQKDSCGHEWRAVINDRSQGCGCRECAIKAKSTPGKGESLAEVNPALATEWHPRKNGKLTPFDLLPRSGKKVWWLCPEYSCGHEWEANVLNRSNGTGCYECARKSRSIPDKGESLAELHPELAKEWHTTKNGALTPLSVLSSNSKKVWWLCSKNSCGREWRTRINYRVEGGGCHECAKQARAKSKATPYDGESLAEIYPALAKEWHPTKNSELTPFNVMTGSNRKVWWLCPKQSCGHEWEASAGNRTRGGRQWGRGCPKCAVHGYKSTKPGHYYIIANDSYLKVGISNVPESRAMILRNKHRGIILFISEAYNGVNIRRAESDWKIALGLGQVSDLYDKDGKSETMPHKTLPAFIRMAADLGILSKNDEKEIRKRYREEFGARYFDIFSANLIVSMPGS